MKRIFKVTFGVLTLSMLFSIMGIVILLAANAEGHWLFDWNYMQIMAAAIGGMLAYLAAILLVLHKSGSEGVNSRLPFAAMFAAFHMAALIAGLLTR